MDEIKRRMPELLNNSFDEDSIHSVEITYTIDPLNFYVRPIKYKPIINLFENLEPKHKTTTFNIQDLVIFNVGYNSGTRKFVRGRITRIIKVDNVVRCDIFAIDYGFKEKLFPVQYIWECSQQMAITPSLAYFCQLALCYPIGPEGFAPDADYALEYYAGREPAKMTVLGKTPEKILIELENASKESVLSLLAMSGYVFVGQNTRSWNPFIGNKIIHFDFKELIIGEKLHVRVLYRNSLNEFYVAGVNDYKKFLEEYDIMQSYARKEFPLAPVHLIEGTLICVYIQERNKYERGFIARVTRPKVSAIVTLVDCGKQEEFHVRKMTYLPPRCLLTPVLSIYCISDIQQAWNTGIGRFLYPGFELNIKIKSLGHEFESPNKVEITTLVAGENEVKALPDDILNE